MSSNARPISPVRFLEAIKELPVGSLHAKAAELRNSIAHLESSNEQLKDFADAGDRDCAEAISENQQVIQRMEQRIQLLRVEVEGRGLRWYEDHDAQGTDGAAAAVDGDGDTAMNGHADTEELPSANRSPSAQDAPASAQRSGRLTDQELQRLLAERLGEADAVEGEEGVHL